jgi:hypothetical protein
VSLTPFSNRVQVPLHDGSALTLVLNFRAIDEIEGAFGLPMPSIIPELLRDNARYSTIGKVVWAMLRECHEDTTLDDALGLALGEDQAAIGVALGELFRRAFNIGEVKDENPPKRRGRSRSSAKSG